MLGTSPVARADALVRSTPASNHRIGAEPDAGFASLRAGVAAHRLLAPRRAAYAAYAVAIGAALVLAATALGLGESAGIRACGALLLATATVHAGFLAHDVQHLAVVTSPRLARLVGYGAWNLLTGVSHDWWLDKHSRHHASPNHLGADPDLYPLFAYTESQALARHGILGVLARHQAALFVPAATLAAGYFRVLGVAYVLRGRARATVAEAALLALHHAGSIALHFAAASPLEGLVLLVAGYATTGLYMTIVFTPNHTGRPIRAGAAHRAGSSSQVEISRNVRLGRFGDFLFGGLNYQIEHHLFPRMPRWNLRRAAKLTRRHCAARGIPYHEVEVLDAWREIFVYLHDVGAAARRHAATSSRTDVPTRMTQCASPDSRTTSADGSGGTGRCSPTVAI